MSDRFDLFLFSTDVETIEPAVAAGVAGVVVDWERVGKRWFSTFAGVVLIEATKQIYAKPVAVRTPRRRLVYTPAPHGL